MEEPNNKSSEEEASLDEEEFKQKSADELLQEIKHQKKLYRMTKKSKQALDDEISELHSII